jgi:hypothetical protein
LACSACCAVGWDSRSEDDDSVFLTNISNHARLHGVTRYIASLIITAVQISCHMHSLLIPVANQEFFSEGVQQIQLRTEDRENGDLGAVAP